MKRRVTYGSHELGNVEQNWRSFFHNHDLDIAYQEKLLAEVVEQLEELERKHSPEHARYLAMYLEMRDEHMEHIRRALRIAESECPIGYFKPSWEQAQIINSWSPHFEPDKAPNGYQSVGIFSANRIGKSCAVFISVLLWILPNNPEWAMFREMEDPPLYNIRNDPKSGIKRASRGKYRVFPRPNWDHWVRTGKLIEPIKGEAPMSPCDAWHGCDSDTTWNDRIMGEWADRGGKDGYLAWMPKDAVARRGDGGLAIFKQERKITLKSGHSIYGKTFGADDTAWAGKLARIVAMDEGFQEEKLIESRTRLEANGYYLWAYTPTAARNLGNVAAVAFKCYEGKLPLVGATKFFTNFTMEDAPEHVLPSAKREADMAAFSLLGEKGRSRMMGGFFSSSPNVFGNYDRDRNVLPIDGSEVMQAIRGKTVERWVKAFGQSRADHLHWALHQANIARGFDEGLANPSACVWGALMRTNEWIVFREWEQAGLSVSERCSAIIDFSGNKLVCLNPESIEERRRYREEIDPQNGMRVRRSYADSKMFKRDQLSPQDDWCSNYSRAGLKIERATNIGPAARCDFVNNMLRGDGGRKHLLDPDLSGCEVYVTRDCAKLQERFANYLWQQIATGSRTGEFTEKPETKDDHTLDAGAYLLCSKLRWVDLEVQQQGSGVRYDGLTGAVIR